MPLPKPRGGKTPETKQAWLSRCYADPTVRHEFDDDNNRIGGYCYTAWKDHKAKAAYVVRAGDDEYAIAKEPIDTDIKRREKQAGDPPKDAMPNPEKGGPASSPNPDGTTKTPLKDMPVFLGGLELEVDEQGLAKWPLSFKRVEKDTKRPNKGGSGPVVPKAPENDQPPTAS